MKNFISQIEHIGIIVKDLKKSLCPYQELLGIEIKEIEEIQEQGAIYRLAFLPIAEVNIELVETSASDGLVADFIRERGDRIHHIAFKVNNLEALFNELKGRGIEFVGDKIVSGSRGSKAAFFKAEEFNGVYIELVQTKEEDTQ
jgi:methylmalonyl-CoA epimerase